MNSTARTASRRPPRDPSRRTTDPLPTLLDIEQVARHLGVNVRHLRRLVAERRIPYIKWGHLLRFDPDELRPWLESYRIEPQDPGH